MVFCGWRGSSRGRTDLRTSHQQTVASAKVSAALLMWEDDQGVGAIGTASSDFGRSLLKPL
jgi:hypothetical protein